MRATVRTTARRVHLRVGGGVALAWRVVQADPGSSPRGRRSQCASWSWSAFLGFISAWAEESEQRLAGFGG